MKLIHCADLHLDSGMETHLDKERAKKRKGEILNTFERMVDYAAQNGIDVILIAGDMFDKSNISAAARNTVLNNITGHPGIRFYYLLGNHDRNNFLSGLSKLPGNLRMFGRDWTSYEEAGGKVVISGLELSGDNAASAYLTLVLDSSKFNIVMLHGQESESASKDKTEIVNLRALRNKGIDYLALGHVHRYKSEKLDNRGRYCYPGCLEGRGFDECGDHGFVVLNIDTDTGAYRESFVSHAYRRLHEVEVDVTGCLSTYEMIARAKSVLEDMGLSRLDLIKFVLKGELDIESEKDTAYFEAAFSRDYFFVKVCDETRLKADLEAYLKDKSLKGEYVRQVTADPDIPDEDKKTVIRYGLMAIAGEEVQ